MPDPGFLPLDRAELEALLGGLPQAGFGKLQPIVEEILRTALYYEERSQRQAKVGRKASRTYREKLQREAKKLGISVYELRDRLQAQRLGITVEELRRRRKSVLQTPSS